MTRARGLKVTGVGEAQPIYHVKVKGGVHYQTEESAMRLAKLNAELGYACAVIEYAPVRIVWSSKPRKRADELGGAGGRKR